MKNVKRIILSVLVFIFVFVAFGHFNANVKADTIETTDKLIIEGAQVRLDTVQGIRFVGKDIGYVAPSGKVIVRYGIAIAKGDAEVSNDFVKGGTINERSVLTGETVFDKDNEFYVRIVSIPDKEYLSNITARPYVVLNDVDATDETTISYVYGDNVQTRSTLEVALKALNEGCTSSDQESILYKAKAIADSNQYMKAGFDCWGNYSISNLYENDYDKLRDMFLADFNKVCETNLSVNSTENQYFSAMTEYNIATINNCADISASNIYEFYHNERMNTKWAFLLNYFRNYNENKLNVINQIDAIKGDGTGTNLQQGTSVIESLYNFFNDKNSTTYDGLVWTKSDYESYNNTSLYSYLENYYIYKTNSIIYTATLPTPGENLWPNGKEFDHYTYNGATLDPTYTLTTNKMSFVPQYKNAEYNISYVLNDGVLPAGYVQKYTYGSSVTLPIPTKTGFAFLGWFDNEGFSGSAITAIQNTDYNDKTFYAKWIEANTKAAKVYYPGGSATPKEFETLTLAFAEVNAAGFTIEIYPGSYSDSISISKSITIIGPNANINATGERSSEAILTGTITLVPGVTNVTINGLKFGGNSQIVCSAKTNTSSNYVNDIEGFTFINNVVDKTGTSSFMNFETGERTLKKDLHITNNLFKATNMNSDETALLVIKQNLNFEFSNNTVDNVNNEVLFIDTPQGNVTLLNNSFSNIVGSGIYLNNFKEQKESVTVNVKQNIFDDINGVAINNGCTTYLNCKNTYIYIENNIFRGVGTCYYSLYISDWIFMGNPYYQVFKNNIIYIDDVTKVVDGLAADPTSNARISEVSCVQNLYLVSDLSAVSISNTNESKFNLYIVALNLNMSNMSVSFDLSKITSYGSKPLYRDASTANAETYAKYEALIAQSQQN